MSICKFCQKEYDKSITKLNFCSTCRYNRSKKKCLDCETMVDGRSTRCRPCDGKSKMFDKHPNWTGGKKKNQKGYVLLTDEKSKNHPNARKSGGLLEHVKVMSEHLGRPLLPEENIHHKNGVRDDNRLENLELWSTSQPPGQRVEDKLAWAHELIALYEGERNGI